MTLRPAMAEVAWLMILDKPIFGCGFDQYIPEHKNYLADRSTEFVLERTRHYAPHNLLFGIASETGLVGLGLFLALLCAWGYDAWRLCAQGTVPLFAANSFRRPLSTPAKMGLSPSGRRSGFASKGCSSSRCSRPISSMACSTTSPWFRCRTCSCSSLRG